MHARYGFTFHVFTTFLRLSQVRRTSLISQVTVDVLSFCLHLSSNVVVILDMKKKQYISFSCPSQFTLKVVVTVVTATEARERASPRHPSDRSTATLTLLGSPSSLLLLYCLSSHFSLSLISLLLICSLKSLVLTHFTTLPPLHQLDST